jgi:hypothetical protein
MRIKTLPLAGLAALFVGGAAKEAAAADTTITSDDPVTTSVVAGLTDGDTLTIDEESAIDLSVAGETGVTIDTNNNVIFQGSISSEAFDDVTGIVINQNVTGDVTMTGSISLLDDSDYVLEDLDGDGDRDADTDGNGIADYTEGTINTGFALGSGRTGIWVVDGVTLTGDISTAIDVPNTATGDDFGSIVIEGNNSFGIRIDGVLDGDLNSIGSMSIFGDNSYGVRIGDGDADAGVTGDVTIGALSVSGENSVGVDVGASVGGALTVRGAVITTGYHNTGRPSDVLDLDGEDGIDYYELDADDRIQGGSALDISADIDGGVLIRGIGYEDDMDDDGDGVREDEDENDDNLTGTVTTYGEAPAVNIDSGATIGLLDFNFAANPVGLELGDEFGFYNRGSINAFGVFNDVTTTAISVTGAATITGGLLNDGVVVSAAHNADAFGVFVAGGSVDQIVNRNTISVTTTSNSTTPDGVVSDDIPADDTAYAIYLGAGANVASITNTHVVRAFGIDTDANTTNEANATTIYVGTDALSTINNSGRITASVFASDTNLDDDISPVAAGEAIAIDARANTTGITLNQTPNVINEDDGEDADSESDAEQTVPDTVDDFQDVEIVGNIYFGSGADTVNLFAGTIEGDLEFGLGADAFNVDNGASFTGRLHDEGGGLTIDVQDGALYLSNDTPDGSINVTDATFGANAVLGLELSTVDGESVNLDATGVVTFEAGAQILINVPVGLPENDVVTIVTAGTDLVIAGGDPGALVATEGGSFLYNFGIDYLGGNPASDTLVATYERKTAVELGLTANQTAIYEPLIAALQLDEDAADAFAALSSEAAFFDAYEDLLPSFSSAAVEIATTAIHQGQSASTNRLSATRLQGLDEVSVWAQEIGYGLTRTPPTANGQEYDGAGFGIAVGIDGPLDNGALFGLSAALIASEVTEEGRPESGEIAAWFGQVNAYLGTAFGPFDMDLVGGLGLGKMESRRFVEIGDDFDALSEAEWWAYEGHATLRVAAPFDVGGRLIVTPQVALTYVALQEEAYTESGGGLAIDFDVDEAFSQRLWVDAGMEFSGRFASRGGGQVSPRLFLGYRANAIDDAAERTVRFASGGEDFTLVDDGMGDGGPLVGIGVDASNGYSTLSISYEGEFGDQIDRHSINAGVRFRF